MYIYIYDPSRSTVAKNVVRVDRLERVVPF